MEVATNVDDYLYSFPAEAKSKAKLALIALWVYPMFRLRPPYPIMSPQGRIEFIERCFVCDVAERRLPGPIRRLIQSVLVAAQNLTFIGYYSDPRSARTPDTCRSPSARRAARWPIWPSAHSRHSPSARHAR